MHSSSSYSWAPILSKMTAAYHAAHSMARWQDWSMRGDFRSPLHCQRRGEGEGEGEHALEISLEKTAGPEMENTSTPVSGSLTALCACDSGRLAITPCPPICSNYSVTTEHYGCCCCRGVVGGRRGEEKFSFSTVPIHAFCPTV